MANYGSNAYAIKRGKEIVIKVSELNDFFATLPAFTDDEADSFISDIEAAKKKINDLSFNTSKPTDQ